jgi:hypothetical protein
MSRGARPIRDTFYISVQSLLHHHKFVDRLHSARNRAAGVIKRTLSLDYSLMA